PFPLDEARAVLGRYLQKPANSAPLMETSAQTEAIEILEETLSLTANPAQTLTVATLQAMARVGKANIVSNAIFLTYREEGDQQYFEGEHYLLLGSGPQLPEETPLAWVWFTREQPDTAWHCLSDPAIETETCIGAFSLAEALEVARRVTGLSFELTGAPEGWKTGEILAHAVLDPILVETPAESVEPPLSTSQKNAGEAEIDFIQNAPLTQDAQEEFAQFELALLTGLVRKKK
ncbi:MAG: hypothetical protein L0Y56_13205, partial [Nitrospira sp.]|nr:hypothetical protein [Nitrospira sp.]